MKIPAGGAHIMLYLLEPLKVIGLIPNTQDFRCLGGSPGWATRPGCARGSQGISSGPVWQQWEWLQDPSPAFRPSEDLRQRDQDSGPHRGAGSPMGLWVLKFRLFCLRPAVPRNVITIARKYSIFSMLNWAYGFELSGFQTLFSPPQKTSSQRSGLAQNLQ